jgi:hypothetical protein
MSSVPAYLFMSVQDKRKYFGNISKNYGDNMLKEEGTTCSHERSVVFNLK